MHQRIIHQRTLQVVRTTNSCAVCKADVIAICGCTDTEHYFANRSTDSGPFQRSSVVCTIHSAAVWVDGAANTSPAHARTNTYADKRNNGHADIFSNVSSTNAYAYEDSDASVPKL